MKYFKFCKTLTQSLMLIEVSNEQMIAESEKIIVLSEDELNSFNYEFFFICRSRVGRLIKKEKNFRYMLENGTTKKFKYIFVLKK